MDAGLAKVVNSTMGTSNFKPLDKIFSDNAKLVGSDEVMFDYTGEWTEVKDGGGGFNSSIYGTMTTSFIQFDKSGTVIIKTRQKNAGTSDMTYYIRVDDSNGNTVATGSYKVVQGATVDLLLSLNVTSGVRYKVAVGVYNSGNVARVFSVCGKTILFGATVTVTT